MDLRWLYIDFNSYFASVEQQMHPRLRGKPVAVIPVESEYTCAIAASYEAKAFGIKTGTMVSEARKLCPDLICVVARHDYYVQYHHRLLAEIDRHIPVEKVCSIDECASKLLGDEQNEPNAIALAEQIKAGIASNVGEYLRCSIGISTNRYLAKIASNVQKPNGLVVLRHEEICQRLADKPLEWLTGIGYNMGMRLRLHGIGSIPELYNLDPRQARRLWHSVGGERFLHMLHGEDLPDIETKRSTVGHSHVLAGQWRPVHLAKSVARRLTCKAASRLRRIGYYATRMHLSVRFEDIYHGNQRERGAGIAYESKFFRSNDNFTLLEQLYGMWDYLIAQHPHIRRIKKISVTFYGLISTDTVQPDMFDLLDVERSQKRERQDVLSAAMDKINHRFGRDSIVIGEIPQKLQQFSGTKIAFDRIPDEEEFLE
jgi:DNA polymerase-4